MFERPDGWFDYVRKSWGGVFVIVFLTIGTGFMAYIYAKRWPTIGNAATIFGIMTTLVLTCGTRQCDQTSSIAAGVTAAGIVVLVTSTVKFVTGKLTWDLHTQGTILPPQEWGKRIVWTIQIGVALFAVFLVFVSVFSDATPEPVQPLLLVFAGVGFTSAAAITAEFNLKNAMAIAGMVVSLVGAFTQIDQVADATDSMIGATDIVIACGLPASLLSAMFAYRIHWIVRIGAGALLAFFTVMVLIVLGTMVPAVLVASGCRIEDEVLIVGLGLVGILAVSGGIATAIIVAVMLTLDKKKSAIATEPQDVGG